MLSPTPGPSSPTPDASPTPSMASELSDSLSPHKRNSYSLGTES